MMFSHVLSVFWGVITRSLKLKIIWLDPLPRWTPEPIVMNGGDMGSCPLKTGRKI